MLQCLLLAYAVATAVLLAAVPVEAPGYGWFFELWGGRRSFNLGGAVHWDAVLRLYVMLPLVLFGPPTVLMGLSYPVLQRAVQDDPATSGRKVGLLQAANIAGCVAGSLVVGLLALDHLGTSGTFGALAAVGVVFAALGWRYTPARRGFAVLGVVLVALLLGLPSQRALWMRLHGTTDAETLIAEDATGVAALVRDGDRWRLWAGGRNHSVLPFGGLHTILGAAPAVLHPSPVDVAIVGLGSGDTAASSGCRRDVAQRVTVFEIFASEHDLLARLAARPDAPARLGRFLRDERYRLRIEDGRSALATEDARYDIIEADALWPTSPYAGNLYSLEFFRLCASRLKPGGLVCTWAPTDRVRATFGRALPHVLALADGQILVGSLSPIATDRDSWRARRRRPSRARIATSTSTCSRGTSTTVPSSRLLSPGQPLRSCGLRRRAFGSVGAHLSARFQAPIDAGIAKSRRCTLATQTSKRGGLGMLRHRLGRAFVCVVSFASVVSARPALAEDPCIQSGTSALWNDFVQARQSQTEPILPDFSYAGYRRSDLPIPDVTGPVFDVAAYGAAPNDLLYDDAGIQAAIDAASAAGGGVVFFPAGQYLVSPSETGTMAIRIAGSRIVLRGAGSEDGGTEIVMVSKRQGLTMFNVQPSSFSAGTVATVTENAVREGFWLAVDDTSKLLPGQWVTLKHQSTEYSPHYWWPLSLGSSWTRVVNNGTGVHEVHQVAEVLGNKVRFREPLHFNVVLGSSSWRLDAIKPLEEVGIEDIRFTGRWDEYPEAFVHHKDWIHDSGWTMLSVKQVVNSWVRRCEFRHVNQAIHSDTASFITFDGIRYTGKKGHTSISHRRGYGVLVKDNVDSSPFHHGPGTGYTSVNVVYLRHQMAVNAQIDNHGGVPHATLLDQVQGGVMRGNGGPYDNYPHHGKYFVFWNFVHRATSSISYDFWDTVNRDSHTFALPIFSGFTANTAITFQNEATEVGVNESFGTPVTPASLFEAQLQLRQCLNLPPPTPPGPAPAPTATPYPRATATASPTPTPTPTPGTLGLNLARNKPSFASTNWSSSFNSPKAFDGSDSSRWSAAAAMATNQFLGVDLGAATAYNCVVMKEINFKRVVSHVLQMSDDGVTYTDIPGSFGGAIGALKTTCFDTVTSRYFRLFMHEARQSGSLKEPTVNEVAVHFQDRPPVIRVPETITAEASGPTGAVVTFVATAEDEKDGPVSVTLSPASGSAFPLGTTVVTATATDSAGQTATETFDVIVEDTIDPVLSLPAPVVAEATSAAGAAVELIVTAQDLVSGDVPVTLEPASGSTFPLGTTTVTATATDAAGNTASGELTVTVRDTTAPVIERVAASPNVLWPPNHAMHTINLAVQVSESVDAAPVTRIVSASSNESEDGAHAPDSAVTGDLTLQVRAERSGQGSGRVYSITVESRDAAGNASTKTIEVVVPHDQRHP